MTRVLDWMSSLGDMTRVRLLAACEPQELSVAELCAVLRLPQSTVSRHLKLLSEDGWLAQRREGTSRYYRLERQRLPAEAMRLWRLLRRQGEADPALREDEARLARVLLERQSRSQAFFASSAGEWDRLRRELFGQRFDAGPFMALLDGDAVVGDLGCGTGETAERLSPFVGRVIAVDASAEMIRAAQRRLRTLDNVELHRAGLDDLPLDDGLLDVALVSLVLHHVGDPPGVLAEIARTLAPGGRLIVVDMQEHEREEYRQQMGHVWLGFSPAQLDEWLSASGYQDVRHRQLPPDPEAHGPALFVTSARRCHGKISSPPTSNAISTRKTA